MRCVCVYVCVCMCLSACLHVCLFFCLLATHSMCLVLLPLPSPPPPPLPQEARDLPFVGERLAEKIWEIVSSGRLRRLEHVDHEREAVMSLFKNIHGVGLVTAQQFYAQVKTPSCLLFLSPSSLLSPNQVCKELCLGCQYFSMHG